MKYSRRIVLQNGFIIAYHTGRKCSGIMAVITDLKLPEITEINLPLYLYNNKKSYLKMGFRDEPSIKETLYERQGAIYNTEIRWSKNFYRSDNS